MAISFAEMNKDSHMNFWGVYSTMDIINFCLPSFLLIMGDANNYQRFFASKDAEGAKSATKTLIIANESFSLKFCEKEFENDKNY